MSLDLNEIESMLIEQHKIMGLPDGSLKIIIRTVTPGRNPGEPPLESITTKPLSYNPILRDLSEWEIRTSDGKYAVGDVRIDILARALWEASLSADDIRTAQAQLHNSTMDIVDFAPIPSLTFGGISLKYKLILRGRQ